VRFPGELVDLVAGGVELLWLDAAALAGGVELLWLDAAALAGGVELLWLDAAALPAGACGAPRARCRHDRVRRELRVR